jgi:hypothetical protein
MPGDFYFRHGPLGLALGVFLPAAALYAVYLYRRQGLFTPRSRYVLAALRAVVYATIILLLLEPVLAVTRTITIPSSILVLFDTSESMSIRDNPRKPEEMAEAAMALGKQPITSGADGNSGDLPADVKAAVAGASRIDLAKGVLRLPAMAPLDRPGENCQVAWYTFGERLEPVADTGTDDGSWLDEVRAAAKTTRLGDAVLEAVDRHGGQSIAAVLVLTDGASNAGADPLEAAARLKERGIPVHTIGLGLPEPDDVRIQTVLVSDTVFPEDKVPLRVLLNSRGFQARSVTLTLAIDDREVATKPIELTGGPQMEELVFVPKRKAGEARLAIEVSRLAGDTSIENNRVERSVNVIDEKIKILYVEGKPRWEYRYLRGVLLRDSRLDVKFYLTEGDRDLAKSSPQHLDRFPDDAATALQFDLVILGDVPAGHFSPQQLARIKELVVEQSGSFLMLAGHEHAPASYVDTPIAQLLPVKLAAGGRERVESTVHLLPTEKEMGNLLVSLDPSPEKTREIWALVRPLYDVPRLEGAKRGATVLLTLSSETKQSEPYPLVAFQREGKGKTMFVGTDQLWRLRFKRGDEYHARFWRQAIQYLTLARLLGENKRIRLETDRSRYRAGERVQLYATVLSEVFEPVEAKSYAVLVKAPDRAEPTAVDLRPVPGSPGTYQGFITAEKPGSYQITSELADRGFSSEAVFNVEAASREMLNPDMQADTLRRFAETSGGRALKIRDLGSLGQLLEVKARTTSVQHENSLWDRWYVLAFLASCLGIEWFVRRQRDAA